MRSDLHRMKNIIRITTHTNKIDKNAYMSTQTLASLLITHNSYRAMIHTPEKDKQINDRCYFTGPYAGLSVITMSS